jgi:hypothetical protein
MTVGVSAANVADNVLDWLRGVAPPTVEGLYVKLHKGDPGENGTVNPSAVTTRRRATMNEASGGAMSLLSMSGSWAMTASETITHISVHDAASGGNFLFSAALNTPRSVVNGDTITMTTLVVGNTPIAA